MAIRVKVSTKVAFVLGVALALLSVAVGYAIMQAYTLTFQLGCESSRITVVDLETLEPISGYNFGIVENESKYIFVIKNVCPHAVFVSYEVVDFPDGWAWEMKRGKTREDWFGEGGGSSWNETEIPQNVYEVDWFEGEELKLQQQGNEPDKIIAHLYVTWDGAEDGKHTFMVRILHRIA